jgi:hypothetical protein
MSLFKADAPPLVPDGWELESHQPTPPIKDFRAQFKFYQAKAQRSGFIEGNELAKELQQQKVVNATVLDFLLRQLEYNPRFLSDRWRYDNEYHCRYIFFWGTIYRYDGDLCIRCLRWNNVKWEWSYGWLNSQWNSYYHALVYADKSDEYVL